jgi:hypothetical protein
MKRKVFILCALCLQFFLAMENLNAQTITDTREYGSWLHGDGKNFADNHFAPMFKFPTPAYTAFYKTAPAVPKKMVEIVQVLKDMFPKPYKESITYGFIGMSKLKANEVYAYYLHIGEYGFQYDKLGKVKPVNFASQFGNNYNGYLNVYINYSPADVLPQGNMTLLQKSYDGKDYKLMDRLDIIPPQNNYTTEAANKNIKNPPSPTSIIKSASNKFNTFRYIEFKDYSPEMWEIRKELVFITADGKLPYTTISKGEYLDFLIKMQELIIKRKQLDFDIATKNNPPSKDYIETKKHSEARVQWNIKVINAIKEQNKNDLNSPAIVHPKHWELIRNDGYYDFYYTVTNGIQLDKIKDVFINDAEKGYSVSRYNAHYYDNLKPEDVKSIIVQWNHYYHAETHTDFGKIHEYKAAGKLNYFSDNPNSFFNALMNKMDWDKLAAVLTK